MNLSRLVTIAGLAALQGADGKRLFPEATVRGWIDTNLDRFRDRCVVMLGGRVMVDLDALDLWAEERRGRRQPRKARPTTPRRRVKSFDAICREAGLK